jgi:glycogen synthase
MTPRRKSPRILVVTPEVSFLPDQMGLASAKVAVRTGGLGDISAALIQTLYGLGIDVHLALPNYRNIFHRNAANTPVNRFARVTDTVPENRIHLAQDRSFYYLPKLFAHSGWDNVKIALAFQRDVINRILPEVQPDLVHCHDWMTGLIPAMTRAYGIPCLFTLYNLNSVRLPLAAIEERGIDAAAFWQNCYYEHMPASYEETRTANPVDFLTSAVFAAHFVNTLSPAFSKQLVDQACDFIAPALQKELRNKALAGCLATIQHYPAAHFNPATDRMLYRRYGPDDHQTAKAFNKLHLQERLKLRIDSRAPLFFWPTRLGGGRRGSWLMSEVLPALLERYAGQGLQMVFIADGDLHHHFHALAQRTQAGDRVAVCDFQPSLYRLAFGAADFVLMPLRYEPCGLPCKIGQRYGTLPIGHDTGGIHDALIHLDVNRDRGNGFTFNTLDSNGLMWGIEQAMIFYNLPDSVRASQVGRIITEGLAGSDDEATGRDYVALYERMLKRPFDHIHAENCRNNPETLKSVA